MTDEQTITALRRAADAAVRDRHLDPDVAASAWAAAHTRRRPTGHRRAIAASVLAVAATATALAVWGNQSRHVTPSTSGSACDGNVTSAALPNWARAGFSPAGIHTPHVVGAHGRIIAVLFVPLRVHQPSGTQNKVLWVARTGFGPLHIAARLEGTNRTVTRLLPNGPGPSYVSMPAAGCWQMNLTWSGQHDTIALRYRS